MHEPERKTTRSIEEVAADLGLDERDLMRFGRDMAKVESHALQRGRRRPGEARLVLVSGITPTAAGEGKTTVAIGLADAFRLLDKSVCLALREPSLGPCFGVKGGGTGGGAASLVPADRINLHFTGDFHAVTAANNLLAAMVDNHIYFGNPLGIDPRRVTWKRVLDMNDRSLRYIVTGLGGTAHGVPRETGFDITAASEVMAMLCLARDAEDLRNRIDRTLVGFSYGGEPVFARPLQATGAMLALLRDALLPNLVQTREGTPALVHGGPFANIAHGCNSIIATQLALDTADWVITEAGFAFDLGAEKFFDIKCVTAGFDTAAVVLVATVRALKLHGGVAPADVARPNPAAVARGLPNLDKHVENIRHFGEPPVVAINRFTTDTEEEIEVVRRRCQYLGVPVAVAQPFERGGEGCVTLAQTVMAHAEKRRKPFRPLYDWQEPVPAKILKVAQTMYGARGVIYTKQAEQDLAMLARAGLDRLPVCLAKTPTSLSDDPKRVGRPTEFDITVRAIQPATGAGFLVVLLGDILRMPGLPKEPLATRMDLRDGEIIGLGSA
ncbi:MAG: formate--tetrahydrofolate ligase [Candidatus Binatia bacterium]|nr:MAG: formate--tetrahydrofolate ligase [Candidatus Binatia bacterium]